MVNDCVMLEGCRVDAVEEEGVIVNRNGNGIGNEIELSLELSIGGSYAKLNNSMASSVGIQADFEESGRSLGGSGESSALFDPQAKREIQALRRQEARKKREEKLKKANCKGTNGYGPYGYGDGGSKGGGGVHCVGDDSRVRGRDMEGEMRENGNGLMEPARKRERNGDGIDCENQGIPVVPVQFTSGFHGGMTCWGAIGLNDVRNEKCVYQPTGCRSFLPYHGNRYSEQNEGKEGTPVNASVSPGRSSSAFSDYQSSTLLGGNTSDNGSNSSYSQAKVGRQVNGWAREQSEYSGSSKHMESNQAVDSSADSRANMGAGAVVKQSEKPKPEPQPNLVNNPNTNQDPVKEMNGRPQTENPLGPQMPCVSTTGNGPNGKTIMGFLYRYTKTEVSIVCVCHGTSFSPAEFVEHAGGINIVHPLKHITVIPSAFG